MSVGDVVQDVRSGDVKDEKQVDLNEAVKQMSVGDRLQDVKPVELKDEKKVDLEALAKQIGGRKRRYKRDPVDRMQVDLQKAYYCDPHFEFDKVKDVFGNVYLRITSPRKDTGAYITALFFGDLITEVDGVPAAEVEKLPEDNFSVTVMKYHSFRMYTMFKKPINMLRSQKFLVMKVKRMHPAEPTGSRFTDFGFDLHSLRIYDEYQADFSWLHLIIKSEDDFSAVDPPGEKLYIGDVIMFIDEVKLTGRSREILDAAFRTFVGDEINLHYLPMSSLRGYSLLRELVSK